MSLYGGVLLAYGRLKQDCMICDFRDIDPFRSRPADAGCARAVGCVRWCSALGKFKIEQHRREAEERQNENRVYMNAMFAMLNGWEVVAILAVVLILFGAKRLPELARGLGQGIKEFKKSSREIQDEIQQAIDVDAPPPPPRRVTPPAETTTARTTEASAPAQTAAQPKPEHV